MSSKVLAALAISAALLATTSSAFADEPEAPKTEPKTESRWYGYQTLTSDAAAVALLALSASADGRGVQTGFGVAGLASYTVAPVVIHGMHGKTGKGIGDLAIRVFTPLVGLGVGALAGAALYKPTRRDDLGGAVADVTGSVTATLEGALIGFASGAGIAIAIDAVLLTHEEVPVESAEQTRPVARAKTSPTIVPTAAPTKDGFAAGLSGTF